MPHFQTSDKFFNRQPAENQELNITFLAELGDATISGRAVSAVDLDGVDTTSAVIVSSSNDTTSISFITAAGSDGESHKITIRATASDGKIYEKDIYMNIVEK